MPRRGVDGGRLPNGYRRSCDGKKLKKEKKQLGSSWNSMSDEPGGGQGNLTF